MQWGAWMIEMGSLRRALLYKTGLFALAVSITACSAETGSTDVGGRQLESGQIKIGPGIDTDEINRAIAARFANAPIYRSAIRDDLIRRSDDYRVSYRLIIDNYRGLEPVFRCPYPVEAIERAQASGWELTRCDFEGAVFLKRLETPRRCEGTPTIPDYFATLRMQFGIDRLRRGSVDRRRAAGFIFAQELPLRVTALPASVAQRFSIGAAADQLDYGTRDLAEVNAHYFLDRGADALVVLHEPDEPGACSRNALGMILGNGVQASVDLPTQDYTRVRDELAKALQYTGETRW